MGDGETTRYMNIPDEAVGLIIGSLGRGIQELRSLPNISKVWLQKSERNVHVLTVQGKVEAVASAEAIIARKCTLARRSSKTLQAKKDAVSARSKSLERLHQKSFENHCRQKHSNRPTPGRPDSFVWTSAEIHKRPRRFISTRKRGINRDKNLEALRSTTFKEASWGSKCNH